jgi:DNA replication protein DnaC
MMGHFKLMEILSNKLKKHSASICEPDKIIHSYMKNGEIIPLISPRNAKDMYCDACGNSEGFYLIKEKGWSCLTPACVDKNAKRPMIKKDENASIYISRVSKCNQDKSVIDFFMSYVKNPQGFVILSGKNGTGKSYLSIAVYEDLHRFGSSRRFTTQTDLNQEWQDHVQKYSSSGYLIEKYADYKLLIIDDLGTRIPSEAFMDFLYAIIDKRYTRKFATIITTNRTSAEIREKFGDAILSRIASGRNFRFEHEDRRKLEF